MMSRATRLICLAAVLCVAGAGSVGSAVVASAYQDHAFALTISQRCVLPGDTQTLTVLSGASVVNVVVRYADGSVARNVTGVFDATGNFVDSWTLESNAPPGRADVTVITVSRDVSRNPSTAEGGGFFTIGTPGQLCIPPPDVPLYGAWISNAQTANVKKVCDRGVTGGATFRLSVFVTGYSVVAFTLPASYDLTVLCNGAPATLPVLAADTVVTLHEMLLPSGAVAAPDSKVTMPLADGTPGPTLIIHNTLAAATASMPARLPKTGGGTRPEPALRWLLVLGALVALTVAPMLAGVSRQREADRQ